jgi:uncharacterized protein
MNHHFAPYAALAEHLIPHALDISTDGSHDMAHLLRVWRLADTIQREEGGDGEVITAAVLLHDCVAVEKNSPLRAEASQLAAEKARGVLQALGWSPQNIDAVAHAIAAHSYSAGITPVTLEAQIVQDADRLDAIGMTGVARCFYVAGRTGSRLYDAADPSAKTRALDDSAYALDHFQTKLFKLADGFHTQAARRIARQRQASMQLFFETMLAEVTCPGDA